ncbi:MAG: NTP transferase domain-containing protein [Burkholderiaceae bacterium]|jgi:NDP-sugar pyrophosphorylase family protein|nr:NTP transferase domain-containing protein [Burkholderiaceae bacterium]
MQIIIPMSGFGERFRRVGYTLPKPLIEVEGRPIVAHVIDLFPSETDFVFVCNQEHLDNPDYRMAEVLRRYCPSGKVVGIAPHKLGPVYAVQQVFELIDTESPVVVNYCDFSCYWNWQHFKHFVAQTACAGAVPAYRHFHPHTLGTTNYAYLREADGWMLDIQEKQPYTANRMEEYASSGTYYFATGQIMLDAFRRTVAQNLHVGGEYYVSLAYKPLLADKLPIAVYPLQHFMQWGTPEDLAEYNMWSAIFKRLITDDGATLMPRGSLILPMAGLGKRFADAGFTTTKPLIPVSGRPMVLQAVRDLPPAKDMVFVLRRDMPEHDNIVMEIRHTLPNAITESLPQVTEGQACTTLIGLDKLKDERGAVSEPVTVGACDNGILYDSARFSQLLDNSNADVLVWGVHGHTNAIRHPAMFGWIQAEEDNWIASISVKTPLSNPSRDPIVIGAFTFRRADDLRRAIMRLIARDGRIRGEFYLDSCINDAIALGLRCALFEVDGFLSWGTPDDFRTFEYWQSCFHKWAGHPYRLERDRRVPSSAIPTLEARYQQMSPDFPCER